jgi:hypothetical protein
LPVSRATSHRRQRAEETDEQRPASTELINDWLE